MKKISTCLWFDSKGEDAANFYVSLFKKSKMGRSTRYTESTAEITGQKVGSPFTAEFEIEGQKIMCLNGGPHFKFTPALSYFVWCDSEKEIDFLWKSLSLGGKNRMTLDKYPWAEKYAWITDKYGIEWQLILKSNSQKIAPAFLFVEKMVGKGEEAIHYYLSLFKDSKIEFMHKDPKTGLVMHCMFSLNGQTFVLMEGQGEHGYTFNEAFSLSSTATPKMKSISTGRTCLKVVRRVSVVGSKINMVYRGKLFPRSWESWCKIQRELIA